MGFRYKGSTITLENYREVFGVCSPDILDEIRSAVLDDTAIAPFINGCKNDSYLLGQLRMAVREFIPVDLLSVAVTGKTVYNIRKATEKGIDITPLSAYYDSKSTHISKASIEVLSDFLLLGVDLDMVDFTGIPADLIPLFCKGLYKGYPMWLFLGDDLPSIKRLEVLMRGMALGLDIQPFLDKAWDEGVLMLLFSYSRALDINYVLSYITSDFSLASVRVLLDLLSQGHDIKRLCIRDTSGTPVYNEYQLYEIAQAIQQGVFVEEMLNPELSDFDISNLRRQELNEFDTGSGQ